MSDARVPQSRLVVDLQVGERLVFSDQSIEVQVVHKTGRAARLCITIPRHVRVERVQPANATPEGVAVLGPSVAV